MSVGTQWRVLGISLSTGLFFCLARAASAQNTVVDAAPAHAVNSFSPPRALGGAIDRLGINGGRSKEENDRNTERLLTGPVLKELLGAGWGTVTYRQSSAEPTDENILHSWAYPFPVAGPVRGTPTAGPA